jgi:hypothetical protein
MTRGMFTLLDQVHARWPDGASLTHLQPTPPEGVLEAAKDIAQTWSSVEYQGYRRELPHFISSLSLLYRRSLVTAGLALVLALLVIIAGTTSTTLNDSNATVLAIVLSAILMPPFAICYGIARDQMAARALLAVCSLAIVKQ